MKKILVTLLLSAILLCACNQTADTSDSKTDKKPTSCVLSDDPQEN